MASDDRQKTVDEALCSLRSLIAGDETIRSGDKLDADEIHHALQRIAAEIEAALKRERAEIATENAVLPAVCITHKPCGNASAMLEALMTIHDKVNSLDEECGVDPVEIRDLARAALSKPARNCDAMPWREAWDEWRAKHHPQNPQKFNESYETTVAFMDWFTAPAAEKGADDGSK